MAEAIIDGAGSGYRLRVTPEGAIPISGTISVGAVTAGSQSYIYGKSGTDWIPALVTTEGKLETTATIGGITTGSQSFIYGKSGTDWTPIQVNNSGAVAVYSDSVIDSGNSTTVPLAANGSFVGLPFAMSPFATWSTTILADQASAANGLKIQWSDDGTNWDFIDQQTYSSGAGNMITFGRKAGYVRLHYTNSASAQGVFRVTSSAQRFAVRQTRKFVGNALLDQDTGQVVVSALQGHSTAGGGAWVDVKVTPAGALNAAVTQDTNPWVVSGNVLVSGTVIIKDPATIGSFSVQTVTGSVTTLGSINSTIIDDGGALPPAELLVGIRKSNGVITYMQGYSTNADGVSVTAGGNILGANGFVYYFDGTAWDRVRGSTESGLMVYADKTLSVIGSQYITNPLEVGSIAVQNIAGSIYATGSVEISTDLTKIGSFTTQTIIGSVYMASSILGSVYILTDLPSIGSFSIQKIAGSVYAVGSVEISTDLTKIGSYTFQTISGTIHSYDMTDHISASGTLLDPKFAIINAIVSGTNSVVAGVASKKIRVLQYNYMSSGANMVQFQMSTNGTGSLTGWSYLAANTGKVAPYSKIGWFEGAIGSPINLGMMAAGSLGGELAYIEV